MITTTPRTSAESLRELVTALGGVRAAAERTGICERSLYAALSRGYVTDARACCLLLEAAGRPTGLVGSICAPALRRRPDTTARRQGWES